MVATSQIKIICRSCEERNKQLLGWKNYEPVNPECLDLTEAVQHIISTNNDYNDVAHHIDIVLEAK